jgi:hypothetical protein
MGASQITVGEFLYEGTVSFTEVVEYPPRTDWKEGRA